MPETESIAPASSPAAAPSSPRGHRKERVGKVLSNRMNKTIIVRVERRFPHPKFKKVITRYSKLYAHDEKREAQIGDRVRIQECRPLSRTKRWRLISVVARNTNVMIPAATA